MPLMRRLLVSISVATALGLLSAGGVVSCSRQPAPPPSQQEVQEFRNALNDGDAAIVDRLLSAKPGLVNVRDENGKTPLALARQRGDEEMAQVLLRHGGKE